MCGESAYGRFNAQGARDFGRVTSEHTDETLVIEVRGAHAFAARCPGIASALFDAVAFVNHRNLEAGAPARLLLKLA